MPYGRECEELSANESGPRAMSECREIRLPSDLCAAAEKKFGGQFHDVNELVVFLLEELLRRDTSDLDKADQALVEQRLKDLGYL
jgi:hypothetical protein